MNTRSAWLVYVVLRLAFFAVPFAALMLLNWPWWLSAIVATLVAVSLSVIFLSKHRETAAAGVYNWRHRDRTPDDVVEDNAVDSLVEHTAEDAVEDPADGGPADEDPRPGAP